MVNETLATVSLDDVYIPVDTANFLDRTKVGINYPYIFPEGKLIPTRIPTVNMTGFARSERRTVSVALLGSDLHAVRQLHLDQGQPHVEVRFPV